MLNISNTKNRNDLTFTLVGRLDTITAPAFEKEIRQNLKGIENLVIDLKDLEYISSAGLRVLLSAQKVMNRQGEMVVRNVNDVVMDVFEVTGFSDILNIE